MSDLLGSRGKTARPINTIRPVYIIKYDSSAIDTLASIMMISLVVRRGEELNSKGTFSHSISFMFILN